MRGYQFLGGSTRRSGPLRLEPLPVGDYNFTVRNCSAERESKSGLSWVITVELEIIFNDERLTILDYPSTAKDQDEAAEVRDGIGDFLLAVDRVPKGAFVPDQVLGARGKCRLKIEEATGSYPAKNKVAYYYVPREIKQSAAPKPVVQSTLEEPDDLPF